MLKIISQKRLNEIIKEHRDQALYQGYELGWHMAKCDERNKGFIIGSRQHSDAQFDKDFKDFLAKEV